MKPTAYDFKEFYATPMGQAVADVLRGHVRRLWPDLRDRRVLVYGYGLMLHDLFGGAERIAYLMPPEQGAYPWPESGKNLVALSARTALPIETSSIDGVILIHSLEFTNAIEPHLQEIWRVLKSNGRLLAIVPNRIGFWSRVDWAPFGQGTPFSRGQLTRYLRDALFVPERATSALYALPLRWPPILRCAAFLEKYGAYLYPALAGVHVVEASKQVYAGLALPVRARAKIKAGELAPQTEGIGPSPSSR